MIFNLLCAPCFAAMGAIKREMNNAKWTLGAIGYMCGFAYVVSLIVYQIGGLITGEVSFGIGTIAAAVALVGLVYLLVRRNKYDENDPLHIPPLPPRPPSKKEAPMNAPTIIIGLIILAVFVAIVGKGIYNRRHGKSSCSCGGSCGGGCGHCASSGLCHPEKQPPTRRGAAGAP